MIINFAYAISRVLGKMAERTCEAKADTATDHQGARRGETFERVARKADAMQLFGYVMDELSKRLAKGGIALDFLGEIDGAEVATAAAAKRFDRSINPGEYRLRERFFD
jgi:hypothetical protein